jgi:hypothetical protein
MCPGNPQRHRWIPLHVFPFFEAHYRVSKLYERSNLGHRKVFGEARSYVGGVT